MSSQLQHARIAGPMHSAVGDRGHALPEGPCLVQRIDDRCVDIIWGESGEHSAQVLISEIRRAADHGDFLLVD